MNRVGTWWLTVVVTVVVVVGLACGVARAQRVELYNDLQVDLRGGLSGDYQLEPTIVLGDIPFGIALFGLRFATNTDRLVEFGIRLRGVDPVREVSSEIYSLNVDTDFRELFQAELAARVAAENLALGVSVSAFNVNPGNFDVRERFVENTRPTYPDAVFQDSFVATLGIDIDYQSPQATLSVAPTIFWVTDENIGGRILADINVPTAQLRGDSLLLVRAERQPSDFGEYGAVGLGYETGGDAFVLVRTSVWLGRNRADGLLPGGRLEIASPDSDELVGYRFSVAAEPYRTDVVPYRATADVSFPAGPGAFELGLYSDFGSNRTVFRSGYGFGF